jgi:hypothetical protein
MHSSQSFHAHQYSSAHQRSFSVLQWITSFQPFIAPFSWESQSLAALNKNSVPPFDAPLYSMMGDVVASQ